MSSGFRAPSGVMVRLRAAFVGQGEGEFDFQEVHVSFCPGKCPISVENTGA